jgi:PUA-domain protein
MRKQFSKSDCKEFLEHHPFAESLIQKKSRVVQEDELLFIDELLSFFKIENSWVPSLKLLINKQAVLPRIVVDKGAIRFVLKGADIMRPGIVSAENFLKNAFVMIVDETVFQPIGIGKALYDSEELLNKTEGKVVSSIHYFGDELWLKSSK